MEHEALIRVCLRLATGAQEKGNHPFGALLAENGEILLTAENTVNTDRDCTRHAELNLVSRAVRDRESLSHSTLYTSTEPCAMCAGAIYWAGIPTVVYGCSAASLGRITGGSLVIPCREIFSRGKHRVEVIGPVLEAEAMCVHEGFWT